MHRTEGEAHAANLFRDPPPLPATRVEAEWLNAVQEEIAGVIESGGSGLTLQTEATDTRDQLLGAIQAREGWINIKDYGAVGDGVTNDYAAIQAAFDAALPGSTIFIPRGLFLVNSQLVLSKTGIKIVGVRATTAVAAYGSYIQGKGFADFVLKIDNNAYDFSLEDFEIRGDSDIAGTILGGITIGTNAFKGYMKNIIVQDCYAPNAIGIYVGAAWDITMINCRSTYNHDGYVVSSIATGINILSCSATNNNNWGLIIGQTQGGANSGESFNINVNGCNFEDNRVGNVKVIGGKGCTLENIYHEIAELTQFDWTGTSYTNVEQLDHRCVKIEQDDDGEKVQSLRIIGHTLRSGWLVWTQGPDYFIEIDSSALGNGEISNNHCYYFNNAVVKNGTGNSGVAHNNQLSVELRNESADNAILFDNEAGWRVLQSRNDAYGYTQSTEHRRDWVLGGVTKDLVTFTMAEDSSMRLEAWAIWRKQAALDTNVYKIFYVAKRDGAGAPAVTEVVGSREENEDEALNDFLFAASGNNIVLQFVSAAGVTGQVEYGYKVINTIEAP